MSKTTHQMALELWALPDVPLVIEMWCQISRHTMVAEMTKYDPKGTAIIWQKPNNSSSFTTHHPPNLLHALRSLTKTVENMRNCQTAADVALLILKFSGPLKQAKAAINSATA